MQLRPAVLYLALLTSSDRSLDAQLGKDIPHGLQPERCSMSADVEKKKISNHNIIELLDH